MPCRWKYASSLQTIVNSNCWIVSFMKIHHLMIDILLTNWCFLFARMYHTSWNITNRPHSSHIFSYNKIICIVYNFILVKILKSLVLSCSIWCTPIRVQYCCCTSSVHHMNMFQKPDKKGFFLIYKPNIAIKK